MAHQAVAPAPVAKTEHFLFLDGLRGLAAFAVMLGHVAGMWLGEWRSAFELSVDFFFMLSGFVIAHAYAGRLASGMSLASFTRARLVRLYPMMVIGAAMGSVILIAKAVIDNDPAMGPALGALAMGLVGIPTFLLGAGSFIFPLNMPQWSLFFELVANLLYGAIARWLTVPVLIAITLISGAGFVFAANWVGDNSPGWNTDNFLGGFPRVLFGFFLGVLLYRMRIRETLGAVGVSAVIATLVIVLLAPVDFDWRIRIALAFTVLPALLHVSANVTVPARWVSLCAWTGAISYPLYIVHYPIAVITKRIAKELDLGPAFNIPMLALTIIACTATAWLLLKLYDEPLRRWLTARLRGSARSVGSVKPATA